jgi:probable HAF family extracellular repeat protein
MARNEPRSASGLFAAKTSGHRHRWSRTRTLVLEGLESRTLLWSTVYTVDSITDKEQVINVSTSFLAAKGRIMRRKAMFRLAAFVLVVASVQTGPTVDAASYTFVPINFPSAPNSGNPGFFGSSAFGVNNAGVVVGNWANPATGNIDGFVYSDGTYTDVVPTATSTSALLNAINNAGTAVGEYAGPDGIYHGFTYANGNVTLLPDFPGVTGLTLSTPLGINDAGTIVGYYGTGPMSSGFIPFSAYVLSNGTYTAYSYAGAQGTAFNGINNAGTIVGVYENAGGSVASSFYIPQGDLSHSASWVGINYPGSTFTDAYSINNLGQIVGYYVDANGLQHGFVYSGGPNGTYTTLDYPNDPGLSPIYPGYTGTELSGINDLGQIAGTYNNYSNGFIAQSVPEPGSLSLLAIGAIGLGAYVWPRRKTAA